MKKLFLGLFICMPVIVASNYGDEVAASITAEQVERISTAVLESTTSYEAFASDFFTNYNYELFIGPNSPLDLLTQKVRGVLEAKRKKWRGTKTKEYRRLQLLHSFLAVAQQQDPFKAYEVELGVPGNNSLRAFHKCVLMSNKKGSDLKSGHWAANATVLVVAHDVAKRRAMKAPRVYEN